MSKVILVMSMSLDGFISATNVRREEPLGEGGEKLHEWIQDEDKRNQTVLEEGVSSSGAIIAGRNTYDNSIEWWGKDGPTGEARLPVFVVSHSEDSAMPDEGVYHFINSIEEALAQAVAVADGKDIAVMGGADIAQQFMKASLIDEIQIHLIPVLFGKGTRLFEHISDEHIQLEPLKVVKTSSAIHMRFRFVK